MKLPYETIMSTRDLFGKEVICIKSFTHANLGRMLRKGKKYKVTGIIKDDLVEVDGWMVDREFFDKHFEVI